MILRSWKTEKESRQSKISTDLVDSLLPSRKIEILIYSYILLLAHVGNVCTIFKTLQLATSYLSL
jgi:hypothetical protein